MQPMSLLDGQDDDYDDVYQYHRGIHPNYDRKQRLRRAKASRSEKLRHQSMAAWAEPVVSPTSVATHTSHAVFRSQSTPTSHPSKATAAVLTDEADDEISMTAVISPSMSSSSSRDAKSSTTSSPKQDPLSLAPTVSPTPAAQSAESQSNSFFSGKQWLKAATLLRTDPSLMNSTILKLTLKYKPPVHVIKFMLSLNPKAAGIPKEGPTPLQVAVEHHASLAVVTEIVQACPFALVVTTSSDCLDPLSYAKIYRSTETDLIAILSRPLNYWLSPRKKERDERLKPKTTPKESSPISPLNLSSLLTMEEHSPSDSPSRISPMCGVGSSSSSSWMRFKPQGTAAMKAAFSNWSGKEKEEFTNVKELCLTVLKGQRRLAREVIRVKATIEELTRMTLASPQGSTTRAEQVPKEDVGKGQFQLLEARQKKTFKTQLIALDMKEQAMRAYVRRMEKKVLETLEKKQASQEAKQYEEAVESLRGHYNGVSCRLDEIESEYETRVSDLEVQLNHESNVNAFFRNEFQYQLQATQEQSIEVEPNVQDSPFVFATPQKKIEPTDDSQPLFCPSSEDDGEEVKSCTRSPFSRSRRGRRCLAILDD